MTAETLTRSSSSGNSSPEDRNGSQLTRLRAERRDPGEATFFYWENHFRRDAVRVLPGEYFVHDSEIVIMTTLGSCIAVCLSDPQMRVGGMNHFMLPEGGGPGTDHGRYGSYAMELLINGLMRRGAMRSRLQAKVFGGAGVIEGMTTINIGEKNTRFVLDYLQTEHIPVIAKDVLDVYPRKVCMMPASGKALVKRLPATRSSELIKLEKEVARQIAPVESSGGSIDLF